MNLIDRIKAYLQKQADWTHTDQIFVLAGRNGYTSKAVSSALNTISHTPPYASWYVSSGDTKANRVSGTYYRYWDMTPEELARNQQALDAFDAL